MHNGLPRRPVGLLAMTSSVMLGLDPTMTKSVMLGLDLAIIVIASEAKQSIIPLS